MIEYSFDSSYFDNLTPPIHSDICVCCGEDDVYKNGLCEDCYVDSFDD